MAGTSTALPDNPYTLGRGKLLARKDGSLDWHDFAHILDLITNVTPEKLEHFTSRSQLKRRDKTVITQVTFGGSCQVDVPILDNIKFFFMSETEVADSQAPGTWSAESIVGPAEVGKYIKLPKRAIDEGTAITLTSDPAATTYIEGDDFTIDYENGLLKRLAGTNAMPDDAPLLITGAFLGSDHTFICAGEVAQQRFHLWFIGDPADGVKQDLRGFALLVPSGDLSMIGDEWQQFQLDLDWQDHPDYGGPVEYVDKGTTSST